MNSCKDRQGDSERDPQGGYFVVVVSDRSGEQFIKTGNPFIKVGYWIIKSGKQIIKEL